MQNIENCILGKCSLQKNGKLRQLALRFRTLVWRAEDTVQNLESPGLSGRVDSPELLLLHNLQNIRMIC